jgi:transposase
VDVQQAWVATIECLAERAKLGEIILFFADPTHPTHNSENGKKWQLKGRTNTIHVLSNSGRQRLTILGGLNALTLRPTTLLTEDNCDTLMTEAFLEQLRQEYPDRNIPLVVLLDNATYNHGAQRWAKALNILLVFLPPYAPNLNLIERLWKFYKKEVKQNTFFLFGRDEDAYVSVSAIPRIGCGLERNTCNSLQEQVRLGVSLVS